jgi:hypothetical protein
MGVFGDLLGEADWKRPARLALVRGGLTFVLPILLTHARVHAA